MRKEVHAIEYKGKVWTRIRVSKNPDDENTITYYLKHPIYGKILSGTYNAICELQDGVRKVFSLDYLKTVAERRMTGYTEKVGVLNTARFLERGVESVDDFIVVPRELALSLRTTARQEKTKYLWTHFDEKKGIYVTCRSKIIKDYFASPDPLEVHLYALGQLQNYFIEWLPKLTIHNQDQLMEVIVFVRQKLAEGKPWEPFPSTLTALEERVAANAESRPLGYKIVE